MAERDRDGWLARVAALATATALATAGAGAEPRGAGDELPGLLATYRDGRGSASLAVPAPHLYLREGESPHPAIAGPFSAEWDGFLTVLEAGRYRFFAQGGTLRVGGAGVGDAPVDLAAGRHELRLRWRREPGPSAFRLEWDSERFPREPVPPSAFTHPTSVASALSAAIEWGRDIIEEMGCTGCHAAGPHGPERRGAPDLAAVGSRLEPAWIDAWLEDPRRVRRDASMPAMGLDAEERAAVVAYLASSRSSEPAASREITLHDVRRGEELYETIGCRACHGDEEVPLAGLGSKWQPALLAAFLLDPAASNPRTRMPSMLLSAEEAWQLAAWLLQSRKPELERPVRDGDLERGRRLVASSGCLACHEHRGNPPLANALQAPPLERLDPARGCLAAAPPAGLPRYVLVEGERAALGSFLEAYRESPDRSPAPIHEARRRMRRLRCAACHELDGEEAPGGEILDRVPPLTGAGEKLRTSWSREVLLERARIRPWLRVRMPHFAPSQVAPLVEGLALLDGIAPESTGAAPSASDEERDAGVALLGNDAERGGLSCVVCHAVGDFYPVADERGPEMLGTAERIRFPWFRRWMLNPGRIVSGTSMPAYFLDRPLAESEPVVRRLWAALELGGDIPRPAGADGDAFAAGPETVPVPAREAIVLRLYMPGGTPAAIAVGLPRQARIAGVSYCFDATECRLAYAWEGGFLDLRPSLGKKAEYPQILGEVFYRPGAFPLRFGDPESAPRRRFRGYRVAGGVPEFRYEAGGVRVRERVVPRRGARGLVHEFLLEDVPEKAYFVIDRDIRAAVTATIGEFTGGVLEIPRGERVRFDVEVVPEEDAR